MPNALSPIYLLALSGSGSGDTAWVPLEDGAQLVAPAHMAQVPNAAAPPVIEVMGHQPPVLDGWVLLLG